MNLPEEAGRISRRTVLAAGLGVLVTGCTAVPGSGPVHEVTDVSDPTQAVVVIKPQSGAQPDQIVQGFIIASGVRATDESGAAQLTSARQFLTPAAQKSWQLNGGPVMVLADFAVEPDPRRIEQVTITGSVFGQLNADRVFTAGGGSYQRTVNLREVDGQWRISDPPDELLIRQGDFGTAYQRRELYFLDPTGTVLVPDLRYLPFGPEEAMNTRVMELLLAGPKGVLETVAQNRLDKAALRSAPAAGDGGVTKVDLTGLKPANAAARLAIAAQIVYSLNLRPDQVAIAIEGVALDDKRPVYTRSMFSSFDPDTTPGTQALSSNPWYVTSEGRIASLVGPGQMMWGRLGDGELRVISAAQSKASGVVAAITRTEDGKAELMIGRPLDYREPAPALKADTLSPPSINRTGDQVWVVQNGATANPEVYQVSISSTDDTNPSRARIGAKALTGLGPVTDLELSPDGVRVAVVAGGRLYLGAVAPAEQDSAPVGSPSTGEGRVAATILNLHELREDLQDVGAVAFQGSMELAVASRDGQLTRTVRQVTIDGSDRRPVSSAGLSAGDVNAVAVSGDDMYVQVNARIMVLDGPTSDGRWENPPKVTTGAELAGSEPFFPS